MKDIVYIFGIIIGFFLVSLIIMLLWNCIMTDLFNFPVITFWQAAGLKIIANLLIIGGGRYRTKN